MPAAGVHVADAKLRAPSVPPETVDRERLLEAMERPGLSVVLVVGPACAGKSTLAAQWAARRDGPVAWLTVDYGDNDPASLLRGLGAALDSAAGMGAPLLDALDREPAAPLAAVDHLSDLLGRAETPPLGIVVDDVHLADEPQVGEILARLIEWLPPDVTVVLSGRSVPDHLPIARWMVKRRALVVDADALALDGAEAAQMAAARAERPLPDDVVRALHERCEGWIGGVCLAVQAASRASDLPAFLKRFSGTTDLLSDFLLEEVFDQHPADVRADLLDLSVMDRFCAPLLEAVTERPAGAERLARLARSDQFVVPLADGRWYRFHQLLREFLRDRAELDQPDRLPGLHRRAAAWFESRDELVAAVDHLLAAGDVAPAAALVARIGEQVRRQNRYRTLHRWFEALPDDVVAAEPVLVGLGLSAQIAVPRPSEASWLRLPVRRAGPPASLAEALVEIQTTGRVLDMGRRLELARWAAAQPDVRSDVAQRCRFATFHGAAAYVCGEPEEARRTLTSVLDAPPAARSPGQLLTVLGWLAVLAAERGDLDAVRRHVAAGADLEIEGPGLAPFAEMARGVLAAAAGAREEAVRRFEAAGDELHTAGIRHVRVFSMAQRVIALVALDRGAEAAVVLAALRAERAAAVDLGAHLASVVDRAEAAVAAGGSASVAGAGARIAGIAGGDGGDDRADDGIDAAAAHLSPRERQVLRLLRSNLTLREVADELYVSHNTVKTHVAAVYRKLGVSSRQELRP